MNILIHTSAFAILAVSMTFCVITGNIDLSIESTLGFSAMVAAWLMSDAQYASGWDLHPSVSIIVMLLIGVTIGLINGVVVVKLGVDSFIVTLAMLIMLRGLTNIITRGNAITNLPASFNFLGSGEILGIPVPIITWILIYILAYFVLSKLQFGRMLYEIGGNKWAALTCGINVDRIIIYTFIITGVLASFAGWVYAGRVQSVVAYMGENMAFDTLAAIVIGGVSLRGGKGSIIGVLGGVLLISVINNSLQLSGVSAFWMETCRGVLIIVAMTIDALRRLKE